MKQISIQIDPAVHKQVKLAAWKRKQSISEYIRQAIDDRLKGGKVKEG